MTGIDKKRFIVLLLIVINLLVFFQVRNHDFLTYDDHEYVVDNPHIQEGLNMQSIYWAFTTMHDANWFPLTWLSHLLDFQFFGMNATGHHLMNLLFHILSSILLFLILHGCTGSIWKSAFVAALFAIHPLHVESVAWVAERKDVLSTFFWMITIWAYVRYVKFPGVKRYILVFSLFILGLMTKPMLVTLPAVMLLLDFWPLERFQTKSLFGLIQEKIPFFILSTASSVITIIAQKQGGAVASVRIVPFWSRIANAMVSYTVYMGKMIWPSRLSFFYPLSLPLPVFQIIGAGLFLGIVSIAVALYGRRHSYLIVGWLWYIGTLLPVIGLIQVGSQARADRYTYIPLIGLFMVIAWGIPELLKSWPHRDLILSSAGSILIVSFMIYTWMQVRHWKNSDSLYRHAIRVTPNNLVAHYNLANILTEEKKHQEAIYHYSQALNIMPHNVDAHIDLGLVLVEQDRFEEAINHYIEALKIQPKSYRAHYNFGVALQEIGRLDDAMDHYMNVLRIKPDHQKAHYNLGVIFTRLGKYDESIKHYYMALNINPNHWATHNNLGVIMSDLGDIDKAIFHFQEALKIEPNNSRTYNNLGVAFIRKGSPKEAIKRFSRAILLNPNDLQAKKNLKLLGTELVY